jgi:molybdopterin molybdotransferase
MIPVAEARTRILSSLTPLPAETIALSSALDRVLAHDVSARLTHPPADLSAMDGWAIRAADSIGAPVTLRRIGESPAGRPFPGQVAAGEAVRIFTGGVVPAGADTVVMQENADDLGEQVRIREPAPLGRSIRRAGQDFQRDQVILTAGTRLTVPRIGLLAAANIPWLSVHRRPRIAILATGDEIVRPGEPVPDGGIVSSNSLALAALVRQAGGEPIDLGIAGDSPDSLRQALAAAAGADLLLTVGGASVGEHDLVRSTLADSGMQLDFWKIAMRPGKPLLFGRLGEMPVLGLPGNPVSALVCALLFLRPALARLQGLTDLGEPQETAFLAQPLPANDRRQDYLRATLCCDDDGRLLATAFAHQDSSMLSVLAASDCLIVRPPSAPAAAAGDPVRILRLS